MPMGPESTRRQFMQSAALATLAAAQPAVAADIEPRERLVLNDDGYVFPYLNDDLTKSDLERYLESYCRPGVDTVAYCVGDMSWPTMHPSNVGVYYDKVRVKGDIKQMRSYKNLDTLALEPGGYFGVVFDTLRRLGKTAFASFRMNDAHFTAPDNANVSEFWKKHAEMTLGPTSGYGYYAGCLNYAFDEVRDHFFERVIEFAELYPQIDGIELDAMRSPYFFMPDKGRECAPLFTGLLRRIKDALANQARRLGRSPYRLTINVPLTPELALESGLDVVTWDAEWLVDRVSIGTYQANMDLPIQEWKEKLVNGTPVFAYINCSAQTGQYLGLPEYRAAAANAYGAGADGIYLFNYPCLFELATQLPTPSAEASFRLPDMRTSPDMHVSRQPDFSTVAPVLDEINDPASLRKQFKHYLFYFNNEKGYRHFAPSYPVLDRATGGVAAEFPCYEETDAGTTARLRFKLENVRRSDRFQIRLNSHELLPSPDEILFAPNGRDTRTHTVTLGPYLNYNVALNPSHLRKGRNLLEIQAIQLDPELDLPIHLCEIELLVDHAAT